MNTTRSYIGMRRNGGISRLFNNAKSVESCSLVSFNTFRGSEYAAVLDIIWVFLDLLDPPEKCAHHVGGMPSLRQKVS